MKKAFKNPTLMFILGAVIFSGITAVVANTISASSITYKETTVEAAIDNLYTKAKPDYTGATTFTPSSTTQTIRTNNKILKSNITINPIPSNYQILNGTANINADKILSGYSAFDNNGSLVTGTASITDCISGTYTKPANSQANIVFGFTATKAQISFYNPGNPGGNRLIILDSNINNHYLISYSNGNPTISNVGNTIQVLNSTGFTTNYDTNGTTYKSAVDYHYMACK